MPIGTSNQTTLSFIKETVAGTTPATPTMQLIRFTGESLQAANVTTQSEEIRNDRATADLVLTDQSNSGSINGELSGSTYDELILAALYCDADWTAVDNSGETTIAATASGFTDSGNGFISEGLEVGQFFYISGFSDSSIDGYYRIVTLAAGTITTYPVPPATETAGQSVTYVGSSAKSGKTDRSYTIQKAFTDLTTPTYLNFRGCRISNMTMNLAIGSLASIGFGVLGLSSEVTTTQISGLTETARTTTAIMSCASDVTSIIAVGTDVTTAVYFTQLQLTYDNALRELKAIGTVGSVDIRPGTIVATATVNPYLENKELLDTFLNSSSFVLSWQMVGTDGYSYVFSMPNVKFTTQTLAAGSKDTDMIINGQVQAILDPNSLTTMRVDRFTP